MVCRVVPRPRGEPVGTGDVGQMAGLRPASGGPSPAGGVDLEVPLVSGVRRCALRRRVIGLSMLPSLARVAPAALGS